MKPIRKISGLLLLIMLSATIWAQNSDYYIRKRFPVVYGTSIRISNKYGDVNVIKSESDSLSVCVTISIEQDDKEISKKSFSLINIGFGNNKDTITITTTFDKKFFSPAYRLGRKNFSVNYTIGIPSSVNIGITNTFGNISVEELSGVLNVRLSQGTFSAKKLTRGNAKPVSSIFIDHGNVIVDDLNWAMLTVLNCPSVIVAKCQALVINSEFSKIRLGEISSLVSYSKSDSYNIESIRNMVSESVYSSYEIEKVSGQLKSKATYGSIIISEALKDFSTINIQSNYTPVTIKTGKDVSFKADLTATKAKINFPYELYPGVVKAVSKDLTTIAGIAGNDKLTKSLISVRSISGNVSIK